MRRSPLEIAIEAAEASGWRWAGMSKDAVFFDRKVRDPRTGRLSVEWKEVPPTAEAVMKFAGKKKKGRRT